MDNSWQVMTATAIITTAVAVITKVVVAVIIVCTILREAVLMTDAAEATPDGDLLHVTCHNPSHLNDTTISHDLHVDPTEDVNLTHITGAGPDHQETDTAIIPVQSLQITNAPGVLLDLPGRSDTELIKAVYCSHQLSKLSHEANYRSSCQDC